MLSIVIPVYNSLDYAEQCVQSILDCTGTGDFEIIIVDNNSDPAVPGTYPFSECRILRFEENLGFPKGVNKGVEASTGDYICVLNSDVVVTPRWNEFLLAAMQVADLVSPCCNTKGYGKQTVNLEYSTVEQLYEKALEYATVNTSEVQFVKRFTGFCFVTSRQIWQELDGLDEDFGIGNGEDFDFCLKAGAKKHRVAIVKNVFLHHFGEATKKESGFSQNLNARKGWRRLFSKWGLKAL